MMTCPAISVNSCNLSVKHTDTRFPNNLRQLRRERGLSQERLARLVHRSAKHLGRLERGEYMPKADLLFDLSVALSVSMEAICDDQWKARRLPSMNTNPSAICFNQLRK